MLHLLVFSAWFAVCMCPVHLPSAASIFFLFCCAQFFHCLLRFHLLELVHLRTLAPSQIIAVQTFFTLLHGPHKQSSNCRTCFGRCPACLDLKVLLRESCRGNLADKELPAYPCSLTSSYYKQNVLKKSTSTTSPRASTKKGVMLNLNLTVSLHHATLLEALQWQSATECHWTPVKSLLARSWQLSYTAIGCADTSDEVNTFCEQNEQTADHDVLGSLDTQRNLQNSHVEQEA